MIRMGQLFGLLRQASILQRGVHLAEREWHRGVFAAVATHAAITALWFACYNGFL